MYTDNNVSQGENPSPFMASKITAHIKGELTRVLKNFTFRTCFYAEQSDLDKAFQTHLFKIRFIDTLPTYSPTYLLHGAEFFLRS